MESDTRSIALWRTTRRPTIVPGLLGTSRYAPGPEIRFEVALLAHLGGISQIRRHRLTRRRAADGQAGPQQALRRAASCVSRSLWPNLDDGVMPRRLAAARTFTSLPGVCPIRGGRGYGLGGEEPSYARGNAPQATPVRLAKNHRAGAESEWPLRVASCVRSFMRRGAFN